MNMSDSNHTPPPPSLLPSSQYSFKSVYGLLEIWRDDGAQAPSNQHLNLGSFDPKSTAYSVSSSLGDFSRLFEHLKWPIESSVTRTPESTDAELSNQDTPPSSLSDIALRIKAKEVRWRDEVHTGEASQLITPRDLHATIPRKPRHRSPTKQTEVKNSADFESEAEDYLRPALVKTPQLWHPPAIPELRIDPQIIQPVDSLTRGEKMAKLQGKLDRFKKSKSSKEGIHIFVDVSNIVFGFYDALKIKRGLNVKAYTKQAPISWQALALILERGRAVARRVLVGSNSQPIRGQAPKLPSYMLEAEECGYELNILERVLKRKESTPVRKRKSNGNGYATTSGHSSSDGGHMALKVSEQGVDEILQMKLLESLVDTQKPSTIVLASGDAAEAEYSGGFLKNVERALAKGWKVELVSWSQGLSKEYLSKPFLKKWKDSFEIIELDDFSEELLAVYCMKFATAPVQRAHHLGF